MQYSIIHYTYILFRGICLYIITTIKTTNNVSVETIVADVSRTTIVIIHRHQLYFTTRDNMNTSSKISKEIKICVSINLSANIYIHVYI